VLERSNKIKGPSQNSQNRLEYTSKHRSGLLIALRTYNVHSGHAMFLLLVLGRYLCRWTITSRGYHPLSSLLHWHGLLDIFITIDKATLVIYQLEWAVQQQHFVNRQNNTSYIPIRVSSTTTTFQSPALTWFIRYFHYWNLQFLNTAIINKTKVPSKKVTT
jgi:hypothetical protein